MKYFSKFGLPTNVIFCKECVLSNQKPNPVVEFKNNNNLKLGPEFQNGVCNACRYNKAKDKINWNEREEKLLEILAKYKKNSGYDCVVPGSGGKDSAYTAHILKYKYKINPLTVTWSPHLYTDSGWKNFTNWIHVGGFDNILFTPNGRLHRYLTRLAFLNLLHPFQPFIIGQKNIGPIIAEKFDIPLVIYGENTAEYGSSFDENFDPLMDMKYFVKNSLDDLFFGKKNIHEIIQETDFSINDFEPYIPLSVDRIKKKILKFSIWAIFINGTLRKCFIMQAKILVLNLIMKEQREHTQNIQV